MEPKVTLEVAGDLDGLDEDQLREIQEKLTPVVLEGLLQKEDT